jgi:hypothetical protein
MKKFNKNQSGFSVIETALILVILGMIGFVGWYVMNAQKKTDKDLSVTNTTSIAPKRKTSNNSPDAPRVVKLSELGVEFTLPANALMDFKYVANNVDYSDSGNNALGTYPTAYLGTAQLDALGCPATGVIGNAPPLGFLTKTAGQYPSSPTADNTTGTLVKQYSNFYISYRSRGFACFDDASKNQIVTTDNQVLQSAIKSIRLIQ